MPHRLDVAARSIDLASTVIRHGNMDLVSIVAGESAKAAGDLVKWLARERISEGAFLQAMTLGRNIAQCNGNGLAVVEKLVTTASRLYGLQLIMPGALGRTIVYDESLRWISTTQTVLMRYKSCEFVVETLCSLFASVSFKDEDPRRRVLMARIRPVIAKVVDSIHLHIVNMGHTGLELPKAINDLPKHYLASFSLVSAIKAVEDRSGSDIVIQMKGCIVDLIDWLFHHWDGTLRVSVNNKIVFEDLMGMSPQTLTLVIENSCNADTDCQNEEHIIPYQIGRGIGSTLNDASQVNGISDPMDGFAGGSRYRSELYDIQNPFKTRKAYLNMEELKYAERTAQKVVLSIVELPVTLAARKIVLRVDPESPVTLRWWLQKVPTILQRNLGLRRAPRLLYTGKHRLNKIADGSYESDEGSDDFQADDKDGDDDDDDITYTTGQICKWYEEVFSALQLAYERCGCGCSRRQIEDLLEKELNRGCLVSLMYAEVMLLIAHAISESSGAEDVSNLHGSEASSNLAEAATAVLGSIAHYGEIHWDNWFRLVCCAISGLPHDMANEDTFDVSGGILLWIAGSMTIVPTWLDLSSPIVGKGSWAVKRLVGVVAGVMDETAVVESEATNGATNIKPPPLITISSWSAMMTSTPAIEFAIFSNTSNLYRLLCMVRANDALRILDPVDVYLGELTVKRPTCKHKHNTEASIHLWDMADVVAGWNSLSTSKGKSQSAHMALITSSPLQRNVAVGLSIGNCALLAHESCCLSCFTTECITNGYFGLYCEGGGESRKRIKYR
jgi:hypothetical protein